ncbi:MAG: hypothetical protein K9M57_10920 [Phycisphaerae bacterium]|nr:hypothetical protein [Phycisphaerae bacterium]
MTYAVVTGISPPEKSRFSIRLSNAPNIQTYVGKVGAHETTGLVRNKSRTPGVN